ncbi:hypothetical protein [Streptomyces sp. XD-27]|uniref:hypothetical protein n=1 Tax=Streptomyces sp. XD-27 TaxID=3062779 RepID=UPI0026F454D5|nr:hypothetical protein [Streptomyces sp. XD-27]WKX71909.1 hypothetical protein Q3Y56_20195 [Streptomyces sp. XD-27]
MISRTPQHRGLMRTAGRLAASGTLAAASLVLPAASAHAAAGDLTCTASAELNFDPPLSGPNASAEVDASAEFSNCTSANGHYTMASATVSATGSATADSGTPCSLLFTATGTGTIAWNTGERSGYTWTVNTDPERGTITVSAEITRGPLRGDTVTAVPVAAHPNTDCAASGLSRLTLAAAEVVFA